MSDGHSGIENRQVNQGGSGNFQLVLTYLKQGTGRGEFVIHATSSTFYGSGLQPLDFLLGIGFNRYLGQCPFHRDKCYYREIAELQRDTHGFENFHQVHLIHQTFQTFAAEIDKLFQLRQQEGRILEGIGVGPIGRTIFGQSVAVEINEKDIPLWVDEVKFSRLCELEEQRNSIRKEIDDLSVFLPLLCGTGSLLEGAVIKALQFLGLDAEHAPKGFTADILAQTTDGSRKFGFEVTGIAGSIKKDSKKLTQLLEFERIKEHGEKTILVASTHNATPIAERKGLEDFTPQVLDFLSRHSILLMTGWELYCMLRDVLENSLTRESAIQTLYTTNGRLQLGKNA